MGRGRGLNFKTKKNKPIQGDRKDLNTSNSVWCLRQIKGICNQKDLSRDAHGTRTQSGKKGEKRPQLEKLLLASFTLCHTKNPYKKGTGGTKPGMEGDARKRKTKKSSAL